MKRIIAILLATLASGCSSNEEAICGRQFDGAVIAKNLVTDSKGLRHLVGQIDQGLIVCPTDQTLLKERFLALLKLGDYQGVAVTYETLEALGTQGFGAHEQMAYIYLELKQPERALDAFENALMAGLKADLLLERAKLLSAAGRQSEAIIDLEKAMDLADEIDPSAPDGSISIRIPDAYQVPAGTLLFDLYLEHGRTDDAKATLA